jgi:hypothetical protein
MENACTYDAWDKAAIHNGATAVVGIVVVKTIEKIAADVILNLVILSEILGGRSWP